ncbi:TIGR03086 family metal-binding protein [Streptomyces indicus]|uniref:TIGR03086 family protein n=1 Tax=Streptomyces indicus TaxID=417292 RepID=A0A1G8UKP8_9ACTN|nr:TIGR03086 family metal-binding protein [Streptomyces indicus]SDJ53550.1 TIGR03086 family protein [Streptomyces indicus]
MAVASVLTQHRDAVALFSDRVHRIADDQWTAPTPCTEWTVRDLVNHLVAEQLWAVPLVRDGAGIDDVGDAYDGDVLGDDPVGTWDRSARAAHEAFAAPGALERTVRLSYGDTPASAYCAQMTTDLVVHAWDLSRATGVDERLPQPLIDAAVREVAPYAADLAKSGVFASPVEPPPGADAQTKLLCLLGRRP